MLEGGNAATATNGLQALQYLPRHEPPRFIILDMTMPVMDAWQFLSCNRAHEELACIPVFVAIGREGTLDLDDFPDIVCVAHKPVDPETFVDMLKHYRSPQ